MIWPEKKSTLQEVEIPLLQEKKVKLFILRDDLLHLGISGNKWRKLKYNVLQAEKDNVNCIVTEGGPFSNHIAAVAEAGKVFGFKTIGFVRGYESYRSNPTIVRAEQSGMEVRFLDKGQYKELHSKYLTNLKTEIGDFYFVPMGGGNDLGVQGCEEIVQEIHPDSTHIAVGCGTGSTMAGIIRGVNSNQKVLGFPAMKGGEYLMEDITKLLSPQDLQEKEFELISDYHFGGFAKMNEELARFMISFFNDTGIPLDGVYTAKMVFGLLDMIKKDVFAPKSIITAIHTGGVQGNQGLGDKYGYDLPGYSS